MTNSKGERPRVLVVAGTRPEAIKMAPVVDALRARRDEVDARFVLTGQHTDLVHDVVRRFGLEADRDLELMRPGQSVYDVAHGVLDGLRDVVRETRAQALLVQGDTATVAFGAMVGFLERIWVGHVEAGLRSGDPDRPWPEENFRRLTDVLSRGFFCPTPAAADNLRRENHPESGIHVTGNTVVDALLRVTGAPSTTSSGVAGAGSDDTSPDHSYEDGVLADVTARCRQEGRPLVLLTAHRRESFGAPLRGVFRGVRELVSSEGDLEVVYPVHPNPNVRGPAMEELAGRDRIHLTGPVGYFDLVHLLQEAALVLTDSGGIQEEAPTFGTPVLVLREVTERPEGVAAGVAELVGTSPGRIVERARARLARWRGGDAGVARTENPYGDGRAGERIADLTLHHLTGATRRTEDWRPGESDLPGGAA